ncbi:MAG: D-2-hydroxyacid dehydrogenase [Clostridia bacterium]|nr:D-2-hydroxyacid dehydrogenase [Clostridia bacterium]
MKIVILDAQTVSKNDIDLNVFSKYGELVVHQLTSPSDTSERIKDADIVICNKTVLGENEIKNAKNLRFITLFATGYNNIDVDYCRERGIVVSNAASYSTDAVAQHTFALILEHFSNVGKYAAFVEKGGWMDTPSFSPFVFPTDEIAGKTLGIFGLGSIGKAVADIALAFKMKVIAHSRTPKNYKDVKDVNFDELLENSDVISLHSPLNDSTKMIFDDTAFGKMKNGAYFVNTARGAVTDEYALARALESGKLSGAAIDVLTNEPMRKDCPIFNAPNVTITPHVAWAPLTTRKRLIDILCGNIEAFIDGNPINKVN